MSRILITGALGHIGSKLIRELDHELVLLDDLSTQRYPSLFGLDHKFIQGDIRDVDLSFMKDIDIVVHLAAKTDAEASVDKRGEYFNVNVDGLQRIVDACVEYDCKLIFPSTTSINNDSPNNNYAESKKVAEDMLAQMDFPYVILRLGTIFGPSIGMRFHTAVNKFVWQAVHGQPITVWKTAMNQVRPYLDLNDCVESIKYIIANDMFDGKTYNVVTDNYTVEKIIDIIKERIPDLSISYVDSAIMNQKSYEVKHTLPNRIADGGLRIRTYETIDLFHEA